MKYAIYTYYKIKIDCFELFVFVYFPKKSKGVWHLWFLVKQIVIFNIGFGFCVVNSIWEHRLKIFFDPKSRKTPPPPNRTFSQKCEQFSYGTFGGIF